MEVNRRITGKDLVNIAKRMVNAFNPSYGYTVDVILRKFKNNETIKIDTLEIPIYFYPRRDLQKAINGYYDQYF